MCGIYACIGDNAYEKVFKGLKLLQYRGYDSCGIAYFDDGFNINKTVGTLEKLKKVETKSKLAFGHTRWATNGIVNETNAHPHISFDKTLTIVHNGIIKNSEEIKQSLINQGVNFYSETDTEVIVNYLANKSKTHGIENAIKSMYTDLKGSFSLIIGTNKGVLYLVKKFSPLNLLSADDGNIYISSDISSLEDGMLYSLKDYDIIKIEDNKISGLFETNLEYTKHSNKLKELNLKEYKYYMEKEIYETPNAIKNTYFSIADNDVIDVIKNYEEITLIGCGTAYHSCLIGEYLLKRVTNKRIETYLASNYDIKSKINDKHLHIIVSQSGETADCIKVAEQINLFKGKLLVITNENKSTIAKMADFHIFTNAEKEIAVASTKTYCCQVFVFAYICQKLKNENYSIDIDNFVCHLQNYIINVDVSRVAEQLKNIDKLILVGRDIDYLTLLEASLKIREIDYIYTLPMYSGELKHGTLSLIDENSFVLTLNTETGSSKLQNTINEIASRKGRVIDMSKFMCSITDNSYSAIYAIIPFQLLSYQIAVLNGRNPDMPRNLAKSVTVEWC